MLYLCTRNNKSKKCKQKISSVSAFSPPFCVCFLARTAITKV